MAWRKGIPGSPFELEVARGAVPGVSSVDKFGRNIEVDSGVSADVWDGGHTLASGGVSLDWVAPTAANKHNIKSSDTDDDGDPAGDGARTIRIYGLKDWDLKEITEDIVMNGTTNVPMVNDMVIIHRMKVLTKGATDVNVGLITATATAPSATTVTAQILAGSGQTEMAIYGVPSIQKVYMNFFYGELDKAGGAAGSVDVCLMVNPEPDVELLNFLVKHRFGLQTVGTSAYPHPFDPPKEIPGPAIIKARVVSGANDMDISAGFDFILVDNSYG